MGQTLTHGIYLPDEGERNCYNGLAANWQLLDGAVGTIAEHTTALAGKAPAVHTHGNITNDGKLGTTANKPLITGTGGVVQAGSFGNAANTFCEGNDSRLSDARTPVAHTHTKSDVTDLLNSNFIPSANNSYDLGSSSYQWNNLYAKNYYYNGTAWGLDKDNTWTNRNLYENYSLTIRDNNIQDTTPPDSDTGKGIIEVWNKDNHYWGGFGYKWLANGNSELVIALSNWNGNVQGYWEYKIGVNKAFNDLYFAPPHNLVNLGTSTNKWKSLNGINPGALSLPDYDSAAKLNLTSTFPTPDSNSNIYYTPTMNGWLYICFKISSATTIVASDSIFYIQAKDNNIANANFVQTSWMLKSGGTNSLAIFFPVVANKQFVIQINFTGYTLTKVFLIPGLGHVA